MHDKQLAQSAAQSRFTPHNLNILMLVLFLCSVKKGVSNKMNMRNL